LDVRCDTFIYWARAELRLAGKPSSASDALLRNAEKCIDAMVNDSQKRKWAGFVTDLRKEFGSSMSSQPDTRE
jgi:hypothetical protein